MQIFVLHPNMKKNAIMLFNRDKRRAISTLKEALQCLATISPVDLPKKDGSPYSRRKQTLNHPITRWIREDYSHVEAVVSLCYFLNEEYYKRTGKISGFTDAVKACLSTGIDLVEEPKVQWKFITKMTKPLHVNTFISYRLYLSMKQSGYFSNSTIK